MNDDTLKKLALALLAAFLLLPVLPTILHKLAPTPVTFERAEAAFTAAGMSVDNVTPIEPAQLEAVAQVAMYVNGVVVTIYKYDNEGHIVKQMEYQKPDSGSAAVEAMGIAQSLGARVQHQVPLTVTRNGIFMLIATSEDKDLNRRIAKVFEGL